MKHIGIVYERPLDSGGVEAHLFSVFKNLDRNKFKYSIFSPVSNTFGMKCAALEVNVNQLTRFQPLSISTIYQLQQMFRKQEIDLVHVHSPVAAISGGIAAKLCKLPCVATVHLPAQRYYGIKDTLRAKFGRFVYVELDRILNYLIADRLIYVSDYIRRDAIANHRAPIGRAVYIPNGIELHKFQISSLPNDLRQQYAIPDKALLISFVGRLDAQKGIDILLDALTRIDPMIKSKIRVWIIGAGPEEIALKTLCRNVGLNEMVQFVGYQDNIIPFLYSSDIFVLPSRYEGMPISLLEALAAGLPCIVSDVGENAHIVEHCIHGLVVPPDQPIALANAVQDLVTDENLRVRLGKNAKIRSLDFGENIMVEQLEKLYKSLL